MRPDRPAKPRRAASQPACRFAPPRLGSALAAWPFGLAKRLASPPSSPVRQTFAAFASPPASIPASALTLILTSSTPTPLRPCSCPVRPSVYRKRPVYGGVCPSGRLLYKGWLYKSLPEFCSGALASAGLGAASKVYRAV